MTQNEWKQIPRKLRAALVQINSYGVPTLSADTEQEMLRRGWMEQGTRHVFINRNGSAVRTDATYTDWVPTFEGVKARNLQYKGVR